jgi:hypothetical protein
MSATKLMLGRWRHVANVDAFAHFNKLICHVRLTAACVSRARRA